MVKQQQWAGGVGLYFYDDVGRWLRGADALSCCSFVCMRFRWVSGLTSNIELTSHIWFRLTCSGWLVVVVVWLSVGCLVGCLARSLGHGIGETVQKVIY